MPRYSKKSKDKLASCDERLQEIFNEVIKHYDCSILEGHRTKELQNHYYDTGRSHLKWPRSKHNKSPSLAVDVAPYPIDWDDLDRFYHFAGYVQGVAKSLGYTLRWGGDWDQDLSFSDQTFNDMPHFELI